MENEKMKKIEKISIVILVIIIIGFFVGDKLHKSYSEYEFNKRNHNIDQIEMLDSLSYQVLSTVDEANDIININKEIKLKKDSLESILEQTTSNDKERINKLKNEIRSLSNHSSIEIESVNIMAHKEINTNEIDSLKRIIRLQNEQIIKYKNRPIIVPDTAFFKIKILMIDTLKIEDEKIINKLLKKYSNK